MSWSHYHDGKLVEHSNVFSCGFVGATDFPPVTYEIKPEELYKTIGEIVDVEPPAEDEWYISINTRVKGTPWADQLYRKFLNFTKELRPDVLDYVSVTSSKVGDEEDEEEEPTEHDDENTLVKVRAAIFDALGNTTPTERVNDIINSLQNYGILFRERR